MNLNRSFAVAVLAAMLAGSVLAQSPAARDDEGIFAEVEEALQAAPTLVAARITIRIRDGHVTLSGLADTMKDVATAGRLAGRVAGVTGVSNRIRIADRPMRT